MSDMKGQVPNRKEGVMIIIKLNVDAADEVAIRKAIGFRERSMPLPEGEGNLDGRVVAEICRGYLELKEQGNVEDLEVASEPQSAAEKKELEYIESAGFLDKPVFAVRRLLELSIRRIAGMAVTGAGCGACSADIDIEYYGQKFRLSLHDKAGLKDSEN